MWVGGCPPEVRVGVVGELHGHLQTVITGTGYLLKGGSSDLAEVEYSLSTVHVFSQIVDIFAEF